MKVKRLHLENFRGFKDATIDFSDRVNVLVGVNGAGKTTALEAIASILYHCFSGFLSIFVTKGLKFTEYDIRLSSDEASLDLSLILFGECFDISSSFKKNFGPFNISNKPDKWKEFEFKIHDDLSTGRAMNLPLPLFYNVLRSVVDVPLEIEKSQNKDKSASYIEALSHRSGEADFKLFFEWFRNREDLENENLKNKDSDFKPDNWQYPDRQLQAVRSAITGMMPVFSDLQVRRSPLRMAVKKNGKEFRIEQLSDGEKCLLAMVGDLARRLAIANPGLEDPLKGEGVVLIDEIELHLHPRWQRMIIPKLLETFKGCQFIVSTHSPQVLSEVRPEDIHLLHQDEETGEITCSKPKQSYGLDSSEILEKLMGSRRRNAVVDEKITDIFRLIDQDNFEAARTEIRLLKVELRDSIPDIIRAETMIEMLRDDEERGECERSTS